MKDTKTENYKEFKFTKDNTILVHDILKKYPSNQSGSAVMPLLDLAMRQCNGWIPEAAMKEVGNIINIPFIKVYEVATFYSMYNLSPVGKFFYQVCTTTPCMLRGAYKLVDVCKKKISNKENEISSDGNSSWMEVECLGACINAPMIQINDEYYEDLDEKKLENIIEQTMKGKTPKPGS